MAKYSTLALGAQLRHRRFKGARIPQDVTFTKRFYQILPLKVKVYKSKFQSKMCEVYHKSRKMIFHLNWKVILPPMFPNPIQKPQGF